ncbi:MAG: hypothetical protein FWB72_00570 [Firmicutes bacterium]|nr:hypothetical protein [Bacillota bacterium]
MEEKDKIKEIEKRLSKRKNKFPPIDIEIDGLPPYREVDIVIDELVPCLTCRDSGKELDTEFEELEDFSTLKGLKNFGFEWDKVDSDEFKIRALRVKGQKEIQGLVAYRIDKGGVYVELVESNQKNVKKEKGSYAGVGGHLFAEAVRISFENDNEDGLVYFRSKTSLVKYYEKNLGAELTVPKRNMMEISFESAHKLWEKYYAKSDKN